jgi:peptide/nickel transport system permease protein
MISVGLFSSAWAGFLARRLVSLVAILAGLVVATFFIVRLTPGDPAVNVAGPLASTQDLERIRRAMGLHLPVHEQFAVYVGQLARADLGDSFTGQKTVMDVITQRVGISVQLAASALLVVLVIGIPVGMAMGAFTRESRHQRAEVTYTAVTSIVGALPEFLTATLLALIFAVWLRLLPVAGREGADALILPVAAVSLRPIAILSRIVRVETLNVLAMDYLRTARGKRLPVRLIYFRHVLPNVVTAALTIGGLLFSALVGGAVVVENVFVRPGLGTSLVTAVLERDYPVIQGIILVLGVTVVVVNTIVDVLVAIIDPRSVQRSV